MKTAGEEAARQTAELLGLRPARFDARWREIDVGEWGGRPAAEASPPLALA